MEPASSGCTAQLAAWEWGRLLQVAVHSRYGAGDRLRPASQAIIPLQFATCSGQHTENRKATKKQRADVWPVFGAVCSSCRTNSVSWKSSMTGYVELSRNYIGRTLPARADVPPERARLGSSRGAGDDPIRHDAPRARDPWKFTVNALLHAYRHKPVSRGQLSTIMVCRRIGA